MIRLLLVRHGKTDWNAQRLYQGQSDVPLNDAGRQQATALAQRLKRTEISAIFTSDLQRASETAQIIATPHGLSVHPELRLREMSFGDWEGLTHDEIEARWPDELAAWHNDPMHIAPPGGETMSQVVERVRTCFDDIVRAIPNQVGLLVAHGGTIRLLLCSAIGLDPRLLWRFKLDNASLSELHVYDGVVALAKLNDTHHIAPSEP